MIAAAELDPPRFVDQFERLKQAAASGRAAAPAPIMLPQHSHMSEVYAINTAETG